MQAQSLVKTKYLHQFKWVYHKVLIGGSCLRPRLIQVPKATYSLWGFTMGCSHTKLTEMKNQTQCSVALKCCAHCVPRFMDQPSWHSHYSLLIRRWELQCIILCHWHPRSSNSRLANLHWSEPVEVQPHYTDTTPSLRGWCWCTNNQQLPRPAKGTASFQG